MSANKGLLLLPRLGIPPPQREPQQQTPARKMMMATGARRALARHVGMARPAMSRNMAAYSMVRIDVHDAEAYGKYAEIAGPAVAAHGGKFLARGGAVTHLEGEGRARNVIIEWPDVDSALKFYNSDSYKEAMSHGVPASTRDYCIVEGA